MPGKIQRRRFGGLVASRISLQTVFRCYFLRIPARKPSFTRRDQRVRRRLGSQESLSFFWTWKATGVALAEPAEAMSRYKVI